jgi:hypothetical protein
MISKKSNWTTQEKLLYEISKQLDRLIKLMGVIANNTATTTTTTTTP